MVALSSQRSDYRPEIQGIRTIGALLVAIFHIWMGRVSGGVDVFFVVSGFLITGSLYRELQKKQSIDVIAFWARIARRVAPVAYLVLSLTLAAAFFWMPRTRWEGFLPEILYSAVHLENIKLMMNTVDYLAREEAPSPVQQFWALSIQVQFYAIWPFLLMGAALIARRMRSLAFAVLILIGAIIVGSLAYAVLETQGDSPAIYFNTFARVWEFALGGLVAIALPLVAVPRAARAIAGWVGLLLVVSCGFVLPASAAFPGLAALWPTLGAALVLVSGGGDTRFGVDRILSSKPLVALGDISFSFYLWHWPVLIFVMFSRQVTELGIGDGLLVMAVAFCGAYATTRWLEQPIQRSLVGHGQGYSWRIHAVAASFAAPVVAAALVLLVSFGTVSKTAGAKNGSDDDAVSTAELTVPGGSVPVSLKTAFDQNAPIVPTPSVAKRESKGFRAECHQRRHRPEVITCSYGIQKEPSKIVALVGGSHSVHWVPALEVLAEKHRWHVISITKSACPFELSPARPPSCIQWNEDIHKVLLSIKPDVVFTTSTRSDLRSPTNADGSRAREMGQAEVVPEGYLKQWARLAENGISVIAVRDNPRMGFDVPECMEVNFPDILKCARPRDRLMDVSDPTAGIRSKTSNVSFVDLTDRFCDETFCYPVNGNVLIYRDKHHLSVAYAQSLAETLGERMRRDRSDLFVENPGFVREAASRGVDDLP